MGDISHLCKIEKDRASMVRTTQKLTEKDRDFLWHPLTQHKLNPDIRALVKAEGSLLYDDEGRAYIDAIASWYCSMYGHCNPYITEKVSRQLSTMGHVVFSGFTHQPAIDLGERLLKILPQNQKKIFYSDNGSTATEIGIKLALQYHFNLGKKKTEFLALENGFHGDTFGAMSVSGLDVYNGPFTDFSLEVRRIPVPTDNNFQEVLDFVQERINQGNLAGFIYEPLVQGAARMQIYSAEHLNNLLKILKENLVITIADEVMTGFGKTGTNFASEQLEELPDIICLSKALTAGVVPMGATSCTSEIFDAFYSDDIQKGFFHGHTYTANPIACTAALAGLDLLGSDEIQEGIAFISASHKAFDEAIRQMPGVKSTRQIGVIYAVDLDVESSRYSDFRNKLYSYFMDSGVFLRPLGNTIYILPPYTISKTELEKVYATIIRAINKFAKR